MCCAPNVYMFVYTLIGAHIVPLMHRHSMQLLGMLHIGLMPAGLFILFYKSCLVSNGKMTAGLQQPKVKSLLPNLSIQLYC